MIRAAVILLAVALTARAGPWELATRKQGMRIAFARFTAKGPSGACNAMLVFSRHTNASRQPVTQEQVTTPPLVMELWLTNAKQVGKFDLTNFEGPDSEGTARISYVKGARRTTYSVPTSGWFSPLRDPINDSNADRNAGPSEVFVFGLGDAIKGYKILLSVADALVNGVDQLLIELPADAKGKPELEFDIPLQGAGETLKELLRDPQ